MHVNDGVLQDVVVLFLAALHVCDVTAELADLVEKLLAHLDELCSRCH